MADPRNVYCPCEVWGREGISMRTRSVCGKRFHSCGEVKVRVQVPDISSLRYCSFFGVAITQIGGVPEKLTVVIEFQPSLDHLMRKDLKRSHQSMALNMAADQGH
jgi:hypothetical protein